MYVHVQDSMLLPSVQWHTLVLSKSDIHLPTVLRAGQAFRWRNLDSIWSCLVSDRLVLLDDSNSGQSGLKYELKYATLGRDASGTLFPHTHAESLAFVQRYLNLGPDLEANQLHWSRVDPHFPQLRYLTPDETTGETVFGHGVRILVQDPWEVLVSFIISSNNNIKRISQLCETLCISHGKHFGNFGEMSYHSFPTPAQLYRLEGVELGKENILLSTDQITKLEGELRTLGFGYRARYIASTAAAMLTDSTNWTRLAQNWTKEGDEACVEFLRQFSGVGPKVADCVALMGCKCHDLVPVDTHVWKIVQGTYRKEFVQWAGTQGEVSNQLRKSLANKAVDVKLYAYVRLFFKDLWQIDAGWAQAVVFAGAVVLDNGINSVEDYIKLVEKVEGNRPQRKRVKRE